MLTGLKQSIKDIFDKAEAKEATTPFPIRRLKSPPPLPSYALFLTPISPPTDLVLPTQLRDSGKQQESLANFECAGVTDITAWTAFRERTALLMVSRRHRGLNSFCKNIVLSLRKSTDRWRQGYGDEGGFSDRLTSDIIEILTQFNNISTCHCHEVG